MKTGPDDLQGWLATALRRYSMSAAELARRSGLSPSTISLLRSGGRAGSDMNTRRSLAQGFGLKPETFERGLLRGEFPTPDAGADMTTVEALKRDPNLTPSQVESLLAVYRAFVSGGRTDR